MNAILKLGLAAFAGICIVTEAQAMRWYSPNTGRWLSRDPIEEPGFQLMRKSKGRQGNDAPSIYTFLGNNAIGKIDPDGLKIWVCTVAADPPLPKWTRHAYFWDDRPGTKDKDGETADPWKGTGAKGDTECYSVDGSSEKESAVMACCKEKANKGMFKPYLNDCHNSVDLCLNDSRLRLPPHSRGDPISNHAKEIECACREFERLVGP
jgi:RHS repeat-associated protein